MPTISRNNETWYSYTLPKEDSKNIWITWRTPWFLLTSVFFFFTKDQQILLHQEIQIQIANWYINSICFNLFWICKNFFNKHDCNFDDVSKNGFSWTFYRQDFEKKHVKEKMRKKVWDKYENLSEEKTKTTWIYEKILYGTQKVTLRSFLKILLEQSDCFKDKSLKCWRNWEIFLWV